MKKYIMVICMLSFVADGNLFSQNYMPDYLMEPSDFIVSNFTILDNSGWLMSNEETSISPDDFLQNYKQHFGMGVDDDFTLTRMTHDEYPFMEEDRRLTHERYNQTYKGVKVEYAEFFLHYKNSDVVSVNCKLVEGIRLSVLPSLNEEEALSNALSHLGSDNYYSWLDADLENEVKELTEDPNATNYPTGELMLAKIGDSDDYSNDNFVLAWKFEISSVEPRMDQSIYIDANNGLFIKSTENTHFDGPADLLNYGIRTIDTKQRGFFYGYDHILQAKANGRNLETKVPGSTNSFNLWNAYDDGDDNWPWGDRFATTAHHCATESWDYFKQGFGRNGCKGNGRNLQVWATGWSDATSYRKLPGADRIIVGFDGGAYMGTYDVVGHEFTHGVIRHTADLKYERESGALNESFADIFGVMVERHAEGGAINDWLLGEDAIASRDMAWPPTFDQPREYLGNNWVNTNCGTPDIDINDCCGVHTNSGVQNYWFHLLSAGSSNLTVNNIQVSGIGEVSAARIAYYNLVNYLGCNSNYNDSRWGSINAAFQLFGGNCSNELIQTQNAWAAVGIGQERIPLTINGPSTIYHYANGYIVGGMPKNYTAIGGVPTPQYNWYYNGPWSVTTSGSANSVFSISDFNNVLSTGSIGLIDGCYGVIMDVNFDCIDCPVYNPNGGGGGDHQMSIYPNPAHDIIQIDAGFIDHHSENLIYVTIVDLNGITQFQESYFGYLPENIDVSTYLPGVYTVMVQQGDEVQHSMFVKE